MNDVSRRQRRPASTRHDGGALTRGPGNSYATRADARAERHYSVEEASGEGGMSTGTAPAGVAIDEQHDVNEGPRRGPNVKARPAARLHGLDGIRGIAALFVVLHHCWLLSFPGYPSNTGRWWLGWLDLWLFRRRRVHRSVGLPFAIAPARSRWQLRSVRDFARRRAWRILPPYWAALAFSLAVAWWVVAQPATPEPTAKSVFVHGLPRPGRLRLAEPQRRLLVDRDRGTALHPLSVASARQTTVGCGRASRIDDGDRDGHRWGSAARLRTSTC